MDYDIAFTGDSYPFGNAKRHEKATYIYVGFADTNLHVKVLL